MRLNLTLRCRASGHAFSFPKRKMNLEKIAALLGQLQTILSVLDQLPPDCRTTVMGTLASNGLDVRVIARNAVKAKHSVQGIPADNFEPLVAISTTHLPVSVRKAIAERETDNWATVLYENEFGAFLAVIPDLLPSSDAPAAIKDVHSWALQRGLQWVKFDADASPVSGLPCYGDEESLMSDNDVVLSA